ncbi:hypothetical protein [Pseudoruegeria sp. HB172150]|uniref:hypothetical protein n=1 Tax=Pseudoruegeria sp. HB172150 TaxID=2721164 RepID=UPI0015544D2D|nr:hypothetical protein [Pseudoruegeria sp. HB172150]
MPDPKCDAAISLSHDDSSGRWYAERVELALGDARNVTVFSRPRRLERAFVPAFVRALQPFLPECGENVVHTDAQAVIDIPKLILGHIQVVACRGPQGFMIATVRFRKVLGPLQAILLPRHRSESHIFAAMERSAADALLNLLRPCIDLAAVDPAEATREGAESLVATRLSELAKRRDDMAFFAYLLKRYIENAPDLDSAGALHVESRLQGVSLPRLS